MSDASRKARELVKNATPGPWLFLMQPQGGALIIHRENRTGIAKVLTDVFSQQTRLANAKLITYAPELLAELAGEVDALEAHNALLRAAYSKVEAENARLREALERFEGW